MNAISGSPVADEPAKSAASEPSGLSDGALSASRPFPGLRPFAFADRAFFFGRESQVFALYRLVENGRFIAVIGSSGSGKSSLVLAGLCGLLDEETRDPNGPKWICLDMKPGGAPIKRLAGVLARLSERESAEAYVRLSARIDYRLRQSSFSFESALEEAGGLGGRHLLLIVDQFEELFRFGLAGLGQRSASLADAKARDEATQFVEILLDADRRRLQNVHVLITMRSDFIGDCAYFHRLPDAVSATQYLVPNLTRGQLEEAIHKPIEEAGGAIEPELVERLINDFGDELDQLPVLQHCLMRLWDRAGAASRGGPRRLTRQTYDDIGRMTEALSRHADEILAQCAGKELAVEQAFRALSELDREGRAIRRALRFEKLLAETGVEEPELRAVLDRFRAPTCSFLVPPPSVAPTLAPDDRVDIGHEALLRRWKKLAGDSALLGSPAGRGWLADEDEDGRHYRLLVSMLGQDSGTLTKPQETDRWWTERPRTAAWANRYGGEFDRVRALIDEGLAAKKRLKRNRILAGVAIVACLAVGAGVAVKVQDDEARKRAEALEQGEMKSATKLLQQVRDAYSGNTIDLATAKSLALVSEQFLDDVRGQLKTSAANAQWVDALEIEADLQANSGDDDKALALASQAEETARPLVDANPTASEPLYLLYRATVRVGDAFSADKIRKYNDAQREYNSAIGIARKIVSVKDSETAESLLIDSHAKIGDNYRDSHDEPRAVEEYRASLETCQTALGKYPQSVSLIRLEGAVYHRLAESMRAQNLLDEARDAYQKALEIQQALVQQHGDDLTLTSNLAATYADWGALESDHGDLNVALSKFEKAVTLREEGLRIQPGNPEWENFLPKNYVALADILQRLNQPKDALVYYQKTFEARREIAIRALGNSSKVDQLFAAAKVLGDHSEGLDQILAYRTATQTLKRLLDDPNSAITAAKHFDDVAGFARAFDAQGDWPDAKTAYALAQMMALRNFGQDSSTTFWKDRADEAAARAAASATRGLASPPIATPAVTPPGSAAPK